MLKILGLLITFMPSQYYQERIEEILGYNPEKVNVINPLDTIYYSQIKAIQYEDSEFFPNIFIKSAENFYWIVDSRGSCSKLYQFFGDLEELKLYVENEKISRKVAYRYLANGHQVVDVQGYGAIRAIMYHFSKSSTEITFNSKKVIKLCDSLYLLKNEHFRNSCTIYGTLQDIAENRGHDISLVRPGDMDLLNFDKHEKILEREFGIFGLHKPLSKNDLNLLAKTCYKIQSTHDLHRYFSSLCSIVLKFLRGNNSGDTVITDDDIYFELGKLRYSITRIVLKTIENIELYEFNESFYFNILPEVE